MNNFLEYHLNHTLYNPAFSLCYKYFPLCVLNQNTSDHIKPQDSSKRGKHHDNQSETSRSSLTTPAQTDVTGDTLGPALHYPLQHYSAIRKKSAGQILLVIQKDRTQTNPKPTSIKQPRSRRPTRNKPLCGDRDPLPHYQLGNPPPNKHMTHGMTVQIYTSTS